MIFLTSFKHAAEHLEGVMPIWSSAVYQPKWLPRRPKAQWMDIRPDGRNWIRPREFIEMDQPLDGYFKALRDLYWSREAHARDWLETSVMGPVAVACWCPHDKAAQRQLQEWGTFVCHTAAVGAFLRELGEDVAYDVDRIKMVKP